VGRVLAEQHRRRPAHGTERADHADLRRVHLRRSAGVQRRLARTGGGGVPLRVLRSVRVPDIRYRADIVQDSHAGALQGGRAQRRGLSVEWSTIVVGAIAALGGAGGLASLFRIRADKRSTAATTKKTEAEAADILVGSAGEWLIQVREELSRMSIRVAELERTLDRERATSEARIKQLEGEIVLRDRRIVELMQQGGL